MQIGDRDIRRRPDLLGPRQRRRLMIRVLLREIFITKLHRLIKFNILILITVLKIIEIKFISMLCLLDRTWFRSAIDAFRTLIQLISKVLLIFFTWIFDVAATSWHLHFEKVYACLLWRAKFVWKWIGLLEGSRGRCVWQDLAHEFRSWSEGSIVLFVFQFWWKSRAHWGQSWNIGV